MARGQTKKLVKQSTMLVQPFEAYSLVKELNKFQMGEKLSDRAII